MSDWFEAITGRTWIDVFVDATDTYGSREFARCGEETLSYRDFGTQVDELATALLLDGVRPGETLAVWMTNSLDILIAQWATYRLGCTLLPLYSYYRTEELRHGLRDSRASTLFTKRDFAGKVDPESILLEVLPELANDVKPSFEQVPSLRRVITTEEWGLPGTTSVDELLASGAGRQVDGLDWIRRRTSPTDVMNVMYTSGTTGAPKGGLSMHRNNLASMHLWGEAARMSSDDVILCHVPLFTNFGALAASGLGVYHGCRLVITESFDPALSLRLIQEERVTYLPATPEMARMLLDHPDFAKSDVSSVRAAHIAGSALEPELMERIIADLAPEAMQAYGMSECGGLSTASTVDDPWEARIHSLGRPIASCVVEVRDPTTAEELPVGERGEIWFGDAHPGSCVGKGYLGSPQATAEAITPDGWFRSGDLGYFDAAGYLYFAGRIKQMFTVGGFNVYPAEIERHLKSRDGVENAYVVGVPDARLGTVPVAYVVIDQADRVDELKAYVRSSLSSQKSPRAIWPVAQSDLPMTPSGKVRLAELGEMAAERWSAEPSGKER